MVLLILLALSTFALSMDVGQVDEFKGRVDVVKKGALKGVPVSKDNNTLSVGDVLRTKLKSYAKVSFIDGSQVELHELSRLKVLDYEKSREVNLQRGVVKFKVVSGKGLKGFRVNTAHAIIGVKGTVFWVYVAPGFTGVVLEEGKVDITYKLKVPGAKWQTVKASDITIIKEPFGDKPPSKGEESDVRVIVR